MASRGAAPLRVFVESAFDDVAALVVLDVVADRSPAAGAAALPVSLLVGGLGDHSHDSAFAQVCADRTRRVGLVPSDSVRSRAWPPWAAPGDAEVIHEHREHRRVTGLSGPDEHDQRQPPTIDEVMDLRAQPAPRPPYGVISRLLAQIPVIRQSPLCRAEGSWRADAHD